VPQLVSVAAVMLADDVVDGPDFGDVVGGADHEMLHQTLLQEPAGGALGDAAQHGAELADGQQVGVGFKFAFILESGHGGLLKWFVNGRWHACSRWSRKADFGAVASVWPPISEAFSNTPEKALCQAQRTFFLLPAKMSLLFGSFSTSPGSPQRRRRNLPSLYETGLKILCWRQRVGSSPTTGTKTKGHPKGGLSFWSSNEGLEPGSGVNEAPVGLQSRALSEPAGECETPASGTIEGL